MKKYITLFFDVEGWYEAPYRRKFNLDENMTTILDILEKHHVKAVFNTCGIIAENFPSIVERMQNEGHEIASHGYAHENLYQLSLEEMNKVLKKTETILEGITGEKPHGIRAPWLIYDERFYNVLIKRGYKWSSNTQVFFYHERIYDMQKFVTKTYSALNKLVFRVGRLFCKKMPFKIGNLYEIPLLSEMDGVLIGPVDTSQETPMSLLNYAYKRLITQSSKYKKFFNLNFHDWFIGSANRPLLLDKILKYFSSKEEITYILAKDIHRVLPETEL